jgi:hypothetical protein
MNKVKDNLNATIAFKSKLSSLNPGERGPYLVQLNSNGLLLYHGTRDGFGAKDFHAKRVGHANTLTKFKANKVESNGKHLNGMVNTNQIFV